MKPVISRDHWTVLISPTTDLCKYTQRSLSPATSSPWGHLIPSISRLSGNFSFVYLVYWFKILIFFMSRVYSCSTLPSATPSLTECHILWWMYFHRWITSNHEEWWQGAAPPNMAAGSGKKDNDHQPGWWQHYVGANKDVHCVGIFPREKRWLA